MPSNAEYGTTAERQHTALGIGDPYDPVADPARRDIQHPAERPVQRGDGGRIAAKQSQRVRKRQQPAYPHNAPRVRASVATVP
ncbi:hypothetical protein GCM10010387_65620 [Streptomyces inusitatus]|uniref:Uncharacterized protein n=1 Tax=Streptomyces inusitatus TaxID=68221 RepID=A0A918V3F0_9ACTN|nr:hypothetical protein GCM10010387_65620 [Streptomyces inusitatus]